MISDERLLELREIVDGLIIEIKKDMKGFILLQNVLISRSLKDSQKTLLMGLMTDSGFLQIFTLLCIACGVVNQLVEGSLEYELAKKALEDGELRGENDGLS